MSQEMTASQILKDYSNGRRDFYYISLEKGSNLQEADLHKINFKEIYFQEVIIKEINFQEAIFYNSIFEKVIFLNVDFTKAIFNRVKLIGVTFENAEFIKTKFINSSFQGANLTGVNLQEAIFEGVNFQKSILDRTNLQRFYDRGANLRGVNLQGTNLQKVNLQGANLPEVNLQRANLSDANLQGANLQGANLSEANLSEVNLQGANLSEADLSDANLQGANLQGANLQEADLRWANLQKVNLQGADLLWADLQEADLRWANLQKVNFQRADLLWADLQEADIQESIFSRSLLEETNFQKAKLQRTNFQRANLKMVNFELTDLRGAKLKNSTLGQSNLNNASYDETTQFPSRFDPIKRGMRKIESSQPNHLPIETVSNIQDNQSSVVTSNNKLPENPLSNFKTLEDFQENLQTDIKEPVFETNDQTVSQAVELNKQEFLETETAQVNSQIDDLSNAIVDQKSNQEIIQDIPVDNQSEESQNLTDPESIPTQISTEQSVSSLSQSNIEQENHEPIYQQEAKFDSEEVRKLVEEEKQQEIEGLYIAKSEEETRKKITVSILARQGQPKFRQALLDAYNSRCAITGCDAEQALEAAHIIPYSKQEDSHPSNGLLLRADIHTLFDLNLIAIDPETLTIHLAPSLRETSYKELHGKELRQPKDPADSPKLEALQWRYQQCEWMQR
jgi:uncharacterized protein YjbI with pentapeptide repeats